jgi:catechol 2,3-dioxygenase-like lactoylglutathione lyase family enzyme
MEPRISLITLGVDNLQRQIEFYRDGLGLPLRDGPDGIAFFETGGAWFSLYDRKSLAADAKTDPESSGFRRFTLAHNVKTKEEVDAVLEQARAAGARIAKEAEMAEWGGYSGYFEDPEGFLWEVAWNPHFWIGD